jgi:hypothetical protein
MSKRDKKYSNIDKDAIRAIKKAIKELGPHGKDTVKEVTQDIVNYARDQVIDGDFKDAADMFELAAWAYGQFGRIKYWKEIRRYKGMAKNLRNFREKESNLVSISEPTLVIAGIFLVISIILSFSNITANVIGASKAPLSPVIPIILFIIGALFLIIKKII